ncbi:VOC family protein [Trujillonella humicola]|uniref:VOC family protein n=1 Tax=Trujillonella humicola TaxID=3383699 RepID=UPI003905A583
MTVQTTTHLNFTGQAREALEFYGSVFGGQVVVVTYGDAGMPADLPDAGRVLFGQVVTSTGFGIMAYDVPGAPASDGLAGVAGSTRRQEFRTLTDRPFFVSVRGETVDEVGALWERLAVGAEVLDAYGPSPWAPAAGMLTDRFGVTWILDVAAPYAG